MAIRPQFEDINPEDFVIGGHEDWLRVLLMGEAKVGKTYTVLKTCMKPAYHINCDQKNSIKGVVRDGIRKFTTTPLVHTVSNMDKAIKMAKYKALHEGYKTCVVDTYSGFAERLIDEQMEKSTNGMGNPDPRKAWGEYGKHLIQFAERLINLPMHVVVLTHFEDEHEDLDEDDKKKARRGRVPMIAGKAKKGLTKKFDDIVFMDFRMGKRVFFMSEAGVYGPGGRSSDVKECPANITTLMRVFGMLPPKNAVKEEGGK